MEQLAAVALASVVLAQASLLLHYEALRLISSVLAALSIAPRRKILILINMALLAHVCEIGFYAGGFAMFLEGNVSSGAQQGIIHQSVYLSLESYASLGTGAGFPIGSLRLMAGSEALTGLILIGWTTSYTYLAMRSLWDEH